MRQYRSNDSSAARFMPILCENNWVFNFDYCPCSYSIRGYHIRLHPMQTHRNRSFPLLAIAGERKNCVKINLNWCNNRFSAEVGKMWQIHRSTTSFCVDNADDESLYLNLNMLFKQNSKNWVSNLCKCHFIMYAFDSIPTVPKTLAINCFWKVCHRHACVFCLFAGCASAICVFSMPVIWHIIWLEKLYIRSNRWHMTTCLLQCLFTHVYFHHHQLADFYFEFCSMFDYTTLSVFFSVDDVCTFEIRVFQFQNFIFHFTIFDSFKW